MFHQIKTIVPAAFTLNAILLANTHVATGGCADAELVTAGGIVNLYVGIEKMRSVFLVDADGYPAFAKIEIKFFKRDGRRKSGT